MIIRCIKIRAWECFGSFSKFTFMNARTMVRTRSKHSGRPARFVIARQKLSPEQPDNLEPRPKCPALARTILTLTGNKRYEWGRGQDSQKNSSLGHKDSEFLILGFV